MLRARQPYEAAHEGDLGWMGRAMVKHMALASLRAGWWPITRVG